MPNGFMLTGPEEIKTIKRKDMQTLSAQETDLVTKMVAVYDTPLRTFVDQVVGLSAADRKKLVDPYKALKKELKQAFKPGGKYAGPPLAQIRLCLKNYDVLFGWFQSRHKYKDGELLAPATDEELEKLAAHMQTHNGKKFKISSLFLDAYRICNGMGDSVRMHDNIRFMRIEEILRCHEDFVERGQKHILPFGEDATGNFYALERNEVMDVNHEDNSLTPVYKDLGTFLCKAHKVTRG